VSALRAPPRNRAEEARKARDRALRELLPPAIYVWGENVDIAAICPCGAMLLPAMNGAS